MRGNLRNGNDKSGLRGGDLATAMGLLTRLPLPYPPFDAASPRPAAAAAWAYPLVGLVVGILLVAVILLALAMGLPPALAALTALVASLFITGALHEDGLADCADGFWGGWTRERRLEIMKDSQIGTYGVAALILSLAFRWQALVLLIEADLLMALVAVEVISRAAMVWVMFQLPHARNSGLSRQTGRPARETALIALAIGGITALFVGPFFPLLLVAGLATLGVSLLARAKIGGQTGDLLGATQQVTGLALLGVFTASL
ncbi:MAG: adenosylcobinamide-GDP ribazoletransferase [Sulfitobacter sp.]|nr:adenosylcobinamide-GDP ribazoletransferase [Sulfitobacter sp.]